MKWTGLNELRESFLKFFESKEHLRLPSYPLIPNNDPSLLLINSGMAPMKKYFLGEVVPPSKRVATCQKCIRTPDIENVGKTARHGTFFEMLGNFSFGDYFKIEAIEWAWEFFTKVLEIPAEKLYCSVYVEDDETWDIWTKKMGVKESNMVRLGKADNFWEHGSGPCGPCSEIYFDRGEEKGCLSPDCGPGCECDRFVEIWNLVFSQFDSDGNGTYRPLENPNIDTGMGLERLACIMQGVNNLFEVDTVQNIMTHISNIVGIKYGEDDSKDISLRVITDHIRSTVFMISDGVLPSNEGRGYVLRRLLRRAARHGKLLGIDKPFLYEVVNTVIKENQNAYPELLENKEHIIITVKAEEERFNKTISQGIERLNNLIEKVEQAYADAKEKILDGKDTFLLYDTFGFPIDLIKEIVAEKSIKVDEDGFKLLMQRQREQAREDWKKQSDTSWASDILPETDKPTVFVGYENYKADAKIQDLILDGKLVDSVIEGDICSIVLDKTPFYAESGGQVADTGLLINKDGSIIEIQDCKKMDTGVYIHSGYVKVGKFSKNDDVSAEIDKDRRQAIMRNHTAAHMLQSALKTVLGDHVRQAGSYVDEGRVRFDFTHFQALTQDEIKQVEEIINKKILSGLDVCVKEMNIEDAKKQGAIALFGEKYGNVVRVVKIEDFSTEFCGGTHVDNSSKLGLFKIVSESSVASGVRRIEGTTGLNVLNLLNQAENVLLRGARELKLQNPLELIEKIQSFVKDFKDKNKEIEKLNQKLAQGMVDSLQTNAFDINGLTYMGTVVQNANQDALRAVCDRLRDKIPTCILVIANILGDDKGNIMCASGKEAVKRGVHSGKLVKEIASMAGGSGGGRPDSAMAGFKDPSKIESAMEKIPEIIQEMTK